jgi:hypothetical protein
VLKGSVGVLLVHELYSARGVLALAPRGDPLLDGLLGALTLPIAKTTLTLDKVTGFGGARG